jgi:tetratricopeptide (TPR) repeat protein
LSDHEPPPSPRRRGWRALAAAIPPLVVGALFGFIGGYFAAGGGRPSPGSKASASGGSPEAASRIDALKADADRDPQNPRALVALANGYYDREDWDAAVDAYEKAVRKGAKEAGVLSDLGAAYRNRGDFQRAVASFRKAREADPNHWQSLINLVLVQAFDRKDPAEAQKAFDELKRRFPEIPDLDRLQEQISRVRAG